MEEPWLTREDHEKTSDSTCSGDREEIQKHYRSKGKRHPTNTISINLVPRSHSVTGNVRSGKVRQYTIFHWLLMKGCRNAIYAPIGLFRRALSEGFVFASSCAVLNRCQLCGGKFCFFRRRKSFTVEENHFKNLRRLCKWYRRKPHVPCHSNKVLRSLLRGTQKLINSSWSM